MSAMWKSLNESLQFNHSIIASFETIGVLVHKSKIVKMILMSKM